MAQPFDDQAHDLMLPVQVEHGDTIIVLDTAERVAVLWSPFQATDLLEQLLSSLQAPTVLVDNLDGDPLQLLVTKFLKEGLHDS